MRRLRISAALVVLSVCSAIAARADVVIDWNAIAVSTTAHAPSPFAQARFMAITQLAVFEAVNAIEGDYQPYLGTIAAPAGASVDAAAVTAAYQVLKTYFPTTPNLDQAYATSLAAIPNGQAKSDGIATGLAAATQMIALRARRRLVASAVLRPDVDRPWRVAAHAKLPGRRRRRFSVAEHHTVRCAEHSRQQSVDRAVRSGSAARR